VWFWLRRLITICNTAYRRLRCAEFRGADPSAIRTFTKRCVTFGLFCLGSEV